MTFSHPGVFWPASSGRCGGSPLPKRHGRRHTRQLNWSINCGESVSTIPWFSARTKISTSFESASIVARVEERPQSIRRLSWRIMVMMLVQNLLERSQRGRSVPGGFERLGLCGLVANRPVQGNLWWSWWWQWWRRGDMLWSPNVRARTTFGYSDNCQPVARWAGPVKLKLW